MSKKKSILKVIPDSRCRDAVMLYVVRILKLHGEELAFLTKVIYSETFLVALKCLRLEMKKEDYQFYNLEILEGVKKTPGENQDTLGDKLVEWVQETISDYREPIH